MIKSTLLRLFILSCAFCASPLFSQKFGPEKGSLVIVGGGRLGSEIVERFLQLAGGLQAEIVVIPTASGATDFGPGYQGRAFRSFAEHGAQNLTLVHTYDPKEADTEAFAEPIQRATGVWFSGGRQWRLADAYLGTKTEKALWGVLERGGVIGGSSAGATSGDIPCARRYENQHDYDGRS